MRLSGKVALVSGGTYGIGATIVERLAQEGASVVFTGRSGGKGSALEARLRSQDDGGYTAKLAIPDTSDLGVLEPGPGTQEQS